MNKHCESKEPSEAWLNDLVDLLKSCGSSTRETFFKSCVEKVKNIIRTKDFVSFREI
jgi:hypothetical protein